MAVLNRLDRRAASLDDQAMAAARSICAAFEDYIALVLSGGGSEAIAIFLAEHPDPLAAQVEASNATAPQLVEKSAIFIAPPAHTPRTFDPIAACSPSTTPCDCHADRDAALLETV
jgi:dsDNA-binding SOS-regulon protein